MLKSFSNSFLCLDVLVSLEVLKTLFVKHFVQNILEGTLSPLMLQFLNLRGFFFFFTLKITVMNMILKQMSKSTLILWGV